MGIEKLLFKINNCRKDLNLMYKVEIVKRDLEWNNKVAILKNNYQNELKQIQFGKFITNIKKLDKDDNKDLIQIANKAGLISTLEYKNLKLNQKLLIQREKHPILYLVENKKIIFFTTKTSSTEKFDKPIKDAILDNSIKEYITVSQLFNNKKAYMSNVAYVLELKNESELNTIIQNIEDDEMNMNYFFKDKDLRLYQKEKAFELFYKNILKEDPVKLSENDFQIEGFFNINNIHTQIVDVTFDKYIADNIDRISNYENYRKDSWMEYLKLYEIDEMNNKNDPTDI